MTEMKRRDLLAIAREWLYNNGYDGLYDEYECGCELEDLMPCGRPNPDCMPGYKVVCPKGHGFDFMITGDKSKKECDEE